MALFAYVEKPRAEKGKGVTTLSGFDLEVDQLKALAKKLKKTCSTGELLRMALSKSGDHREILKQQLDKMGYPVKLAGG